jgi:hypothetical protein
MVVEELANQLFTKRARTTRYKDGRVINDHGIQVQLGEISLGRTQAR